MSLIYAIVLYDRNIKLRFLTLKFQIFFLFLISDFPDQPQFPVCMTLDNDASPRKGLPCIFPFTYLGNTYNECGVIDEPYLWCSTKVNAEGVHVSGNWGYCEGDCPIEGK